MEVNQAFTLVNQALAESVGESALISSDYANIVDSGNAIFDNNSFDKFTGKLVDKVGRVVFVDRKYTGTLGDILRRDGWEYGAVLQKVSSKMPAATANESYDNLTDGASYDPNIFYKPDITVKFFNKYITFEIDRSITERQVKSAFTGPAELNAFVSMLFNEIDKALTVAIENLSRRTLGNAIAETIYDEYTGGDVGASSGNRAVNLLYLYNHGPNAGGTAITAAAAMTDPEFIRYASYVIGLYSDRLTEISTLFNIGGQERFTPHDRQTIILLSEFKRAADAFLQSGVYHDEYTRLPASRSVAYWQGSGLTYAFGDTSKVICKTSEGNNVDVNGVIGVMFDRDAAGINSMEKWVRTNINPKADFVNYFYKEKVQFFNDFNENFIVFFVADSGSA